MTDKERAKRYIRERDALEHADSAHYAFKAYMRHVGKAARIERQVGLNVAGACGFAGPFGIDNFVDRCIDMAKRDKDGGIPPKAHGCRDDGEGGGCDWALFNIADLPSDIDLDSKTLASDITGWYRHYGGPGRHFSSEPYVAGKSNVRILIKQFGGLDI